MGRLLAAGLAVGLALLLLVAVGLAVAYPNLPEISGLADYRPKLPLRVLSADGVLLGEFGEERRIFTPIAQIPRVMQEAVLARTALEADLRRRDGYALRLKNVSPLSPGEKGTGN